MRKLTKDSFIEKSNLLHKNKYDYSKVKYINSNVKVCIICPIHGEFWQRPSDHMRGIGCPSCGGVKKMTKEEYVKKSRLIYGDKYDYSKVVYKNNKEKVCIICNNIDKYGKVHGEFWQRPNDHLSGYECPKCNNEYKPTTQEWIERAKEVHGDKYDYSKVEYINAKTKVCIICPQHGEFWQVPNNHLNGNNCPSCNSNIKSLNEKKIHLFLTENNINFVREKTFHWLKNEKNLYLDFYLVDYDIAIEYQGEQHYFPIQKFGGKEELIKIKERDNKKLNLCNEHNIKIFYFNRKNINNLNKIFKYINEATNKKTKK